MNIGGISLLRERGTCGITTELDMILRARTRQD